MSTFQAFPKIARLNREIVITEKIDGTNACVIVGEDGTVAAQSRNRLITPEDDNFGFAAWVRDHADCLRHLGPGYHYGEWWGRGIQRGYGLSERRFSLFNTARWENPHVRPECCCVVPVLHRGVGFDFVHTTLQHLKAFGSEAAPGFMQPEGIVVWHEASRQLFKVTCENDESPKGKVSS